MTRLPDPLVRYEHQLEAAARRDALGRARRRRLAWRGGIAVTAAAAVALGVLGAVPGGGPSRVERAAAALRVDDRAILHFAFTGSQSDAANGVVRWRSEVWQQTSPPHARRSIETGPEGLRAETAVVAGTAQLYDERTNTVYVVPAPEQHPDAAAKPPAGSLRVKVFTREPGSGERRVATKTLTEADLRRLRLQRSRSAGADVSVDAPFREQILELLSSRQVRVSGRVSVDGREAIRLVSADGRATYLADAETYAPIEWRTTGDGGSVTLAFEAYEQLPASAAPRLLDLVAQHPDAAVDRDPARYRAAQSRLFPNG